MHKIFYNIDWTGELSAKYEIQIMKYRYVNINQDILICISIIFQLFKFFKINYVAFLSIYFNKFLLYLFHQNEWKVSFDAFHIHVSISTWTSFDVHQLYMSISKPVNVINKICQHKCPYLNLLSPCIPTSLQFNYSISANYLASTYSMYQSEQMVTFCRTLSLFNGEFQ